MPNTDKKGQTKRHHYVPQMILRNFSANEATTSLVVLSSGKRVPEAPINRQCYEPYFYGEDQVMERSFSREEANVSKVLGDLSRERLDALTDNDIALLKNFVHSSSRRICFKLRGSLREEHLARHRETEYRQRAC